LQQYFFTQNLQSLTVSKEKLLKTLLYEKGALKMLVKLTPGLMIDGVFLLYLSDTKPKILIVVLFWGGSLRRIF